MTEFSTNRDLGELEFVIQYPRCNFIMLSIDGEFHAEAATGGVL